VHPPVEPTVDLRAARRARPPHRSTGVILTIALAGAAVVAGSLYFVMRDRAPPHREPPGMPRPDEPRVAASDPSHGGAPARAPAPRPSEPEAADRAPPSDPDDDAALPGARFPGPAIERATGNRHGGRAGATRPPPHSAAPASADTDADPDASGRLQQAAAALASHDYDGAERLANTVINSSASAKQRATARLIHGTVQCAARNDQEAAQIDLRNLDGFRALRAQLISVCRSHGMLTAQ
jgi:hypothetical protein